MLVKNFLHNDIPIFSLDSAFQDKLQTIHDFKLTHIPIVEEGFLKGNMSELQIIENQPDFLDTFSILENGLIFETFLLFSTFETNMIPVVNSQHMYQGYVLADEIISSLAKSPFFSENTYTVLVSILTKQYALSEIAKIVESNNNRLYGAYIHAIESENTEVLVRFGGENSRSVIETFERFGYSILFESTNPIKEEFLKDRYDNLMHYLD